MVLLDETLNTLVVLLPNTLAIFNIRLEISLQNLAFTPCKAEQPLQAMVLQEKEAKKD